MFRILMIAVVLTISIVVYGPVREAGVKFIESTRIVSFFVPSNKMSKTAPSKLNSSKTSKTTRTGGDSGR